MLFAEEEISKGCFFTYMHLLKMVETHDIFMLTNSACIQESVDAVYGKLILLFIACIWMCTWRCFFPVVKEIIGLDRGCKSIDVNKSV